MKRLFLILLLFVACQSITKDNKKIKEEPKAVSINQEIESRKIVQVEKADNPVSYNSQSDKVKGSLTVTSPCNVRNSEVISNSMVIDHVNESEAYKVLDKYGVWTKVKILSGSKHIGKTGWTCIWFIEYNRICCKGVNLRVNPKKNGIVCKVINGTDVEILDTKYTWYKTIKGWIYYKYIKVN